METYYVVRYSGPFGFIKPWTAVRDELTFSQQFLTPSIIEGLRLKLGVAAILRHRLRYEAIDQQQERTQSRAYVKDSKRKTFMRELSILRRGVMLNPVLHLAFATRQEAETAARQHLCLCRNEDLLLPDDAVQAMDAAAFEELAGFELLFGEGEAAMMVGYNRFEAGRPMYGTLQISGIPVGPKQLQEWN